MDSDFIFYIVLDYVKMHGNMSEKGLNFVVSLAVWISDMQDVNCKHTINEHFVIVDKLLSILIVTCICICSSLKDHNYPLFVYLHL